MTEEEKKEETQEETAAEEMKAPTSPEGESESRPESVGKEPKEESTPEPAPEEEEEVEVPEKFKKLVEEVENMSVLELNELVKTLEKKFGVSATAVAAAAPGAGEAGGADEQSEFTVELASVGEQKIAVIKAVKEVLGLGLKEAKDLVESAPAVLKESVKKEDAEEMKTKIEEAGGKVNLK